MTIWTETKARTRSLSCTSFCLHPNQHAKTLRIRYSIRNHYFVILCMHPRALPGPVKYHLPFGSYLICATRIIQSERFRKKRMIFQQGLAPGNVEIDKHAILSKKSLTPDPNNIPFLDPIITFTPSLPPTRVNRITVGPPYNGQPLEGQPLPPSNKPPRVLPTNLGSCMHATWI